MSSTAPPRAQRLPRSVIALGLVSLCMDASSELVHSVLPVFLVTVLGASVITVGILEGIAEATAAITKVFSGALSDRWQRRKGLVVAGYSLAALTKPLFPLAESVSWVLTARFLDRIGKGIRGAPRDALIADLVPPDQRNAAYGLRQSLDSVGAFLGPLLAIGLLLLWQNDLRLVLWVAVVPAALAVLLLIFAVEERPPGVSGATSTAGERQHRPGWSRQPGSLGRRYWMVVGLGAVIAMARFSEAFLVLRGQQLGLPLQWVPAIIMVLSLVYAGSAYPTGLAARRWSRRTLLCGGLVVLVIADVVLATASSGIAVFAGVALWGLHMGLTQGLLAALVADAVSAERAGTAFGLFNLVTGVCLLASSTLAGLLWERLGAAATFYAGASFSVVAVAGLVLYRR
ncbi:MAG: MFS transporter [Gammaproteobacteria bacterium]|nr:MFS transporter [Gammaproteobacteria bacterium]